LTNQERLWKALHWEPVDRILTWDFMDCTGKFSAYIAQVYAENASAPLLFRGEDICGSSGPIFSPDWLREQVLPR
jgi:hypothetical protein